MAEVSTGYQDQVSPFAKNVLSINSPSADYDSIASKPTPPSSPIHPEHLASSASGQKVAIVRSQTKRPRKNIGPYQLTRTLGSGSMGKVKLAINLETGAKCGVKIIPRKAPVHKGAVKDESRDIRIFREIALMLLLKHPYIVSLKEAIIMPHHYYLFFEHISGGQILDYIISHGKLKEKNARKFARQMISAVEYCHRHSVVHRDLKIENILITEEGDIKIIDFGLSNLFTTTSQLSTFCGSLYFAAPELLSAREYTGPEVDVWSLGIVFYVLVCGRVPFDDPNMASLHAKIKKGDVSYPSWLSKECKHLLSRMLVTNPSQRATMAEVIRHPWVNKGYDEPINIHYPSRPPIELPLDMNVVHRMKGFEFGNDEKIKSDLEEVLNNLKEQPEEGSSSKIKELRKKAFFNKPKVPYEVAPYNHPLVSIYHLVSDKIAKEKQVEAEKRAKEQIESGATIPPVSGLLNPTTHQNHPIAEFSGNEVSSSSPPEHHEVHETSTKSIHFKKSSEPLSPMEDTKSPKLLKRLSSAVRSGKTPLFHRMSYGAGSEGPSQKPGYGAKISRRISKLISRHVSMQEPKVRNSMSELDSLVDSKSKVQVKVQAATPPPPSPPHSHTTDIRPYNTRPRSSDSENDGEDLNQLKAKPASLKGLFSVSTTSTKKANVITQDIKRVLQELSIQYKQVDGYFECIYRPPGSMDTGGESSFLSEDSGEIVETDSLMQRKCLDESTHSYHILATTPRNEPHKEIDLALTSSKSEPNYADASKPLLAGAPSLSGSDTTSKDIKRIKAARNEAATKLITPVNHGLEPMENRVVRLQINLVKIKVILRLHGIQFRRLEGPSWEYKSICSKILSRLNL